MENKSVAEEKCSGFGFCGDKLDYLHRYTVGNKALWKWVGWCVCFERIYKPSLRISFSLVEPACEVQREAVYKLLFI